MSLDRIYRRWYWSPDVKFEMIKFMFNREYALLTKEMPQASIRNLRAHSVQHLDLIWRATGTFSGTKYYNQYTSVAKFKNGVPILTLNLVKRDAEQWNLGCYNDIVSYDFFVDIDAPEHRYMDFAVDSAIQLMKFYDSCNLPYELRFSGMGFHFVVPYEFCPQDLPLNPYAATNIYKLYSAIASYLFDKYSELIDKTIYDSRRLIKCPYTLAVYGHRTYVSVPFLNRSELLNFNLDDYVPDKWLGKVRNRGTRLFNSDGNGKYFFARLRREVCFDER